MQLQHRCPVNRRGYQWPCPECERQYYRPHSGVKWYVLVILGGSEIEQKGPFETEYDSDRYARGRFSRMDEVTDSIFWLKLRDGKAFTGEYPANFFTKT